MSYLSAADFRPDSIAEYCQGYALDTTDVPDNATITSAIARLSQRFDDYTMDHFESSGTTLTVNGSGTSRQMLPKRCTAVSAVNVLGRDGTAYLVATTSYRLRSSLESTGSVRKNPEGDNMDYLELIFLGGGVPIVNPTYLSPWVWPLGAQNLTVAGTFGWTTCPTDVKKAVALMVYDALKPSRADLLRADRNTTAEATIVYANPFPNPGQQVFTGIPEADQIISNYRRVEPLVSIG